MIEAGLEFKGEINRVLNAFVTLPTSLRPINFSQEEKIGSPADLIDDGKRFSAFVAKSIAGVFLLSQTVTYSIRIAAGKSIVCDCFIDVLPDLAEQFLTHMATARPLFGFACESDEREHRNRVTTKQGANTIESWVGRDLEKYLPGFYWLTLLPDSLALKHGIPLPVVERSAKRRVVLPGGQNLFRFYDQPGDWRVMPVATNLCAALPGVFDIEKLKPQLGIATNFLELNTMLRAWK